MFSLLTCAAFAQATDKEQAKNFGLSIVQKFYDGKCTEVYDYLADVVVAFEGGMQVKKSCSMQKICVKPEFLTFPTTILTQII